MRKLLMAGIAAATMTGLAAPAAAQVVVTATPGCAVYCGPTPVTYDFEAAATTPIYLGGAIVGPARRTTLRTAARQHGQYFSTGPSTTRRPNIALAIIR